jgi:hypothetical protein
MNLGLDKYGLRVYLRFGIVVGPLWVYQLVLGV